MRSVTPTDDFQALIPVSQRGEPSSSFNKNAPLDQGTRIPTIPASTFGFSP